MNRLIIPIFVIFGFWASQSAACIVDPAIQIALNSAPFIEVSDLVFIGELVAVEERTESAQVATFEIHTTIKGDGSREVAITNRLRHSCSQYLEEVGSSYYVLAVWEQESEQYVVDVHGGFVPTELAEEYGLVPAIDP